MPEYFSLTHEVILLPNPAVTFSTKNPSAKCATKTPEKKKCKIKHHLFINSFLPEGEVQGAGLFEITHTLFFVSECHDLSQNWIITKQLNTNFFPCGTHRDSSLGRLVLVSF